MLSRAATNTSEAGKTSSWGIGVALCIVGSVLINVGINIQKLAINKRLGLPVLQRPRLSTYPSWILGFSLFCVGNIFNFISFRFAAQSLLAALGSVQFVAHLVCSKFILKEHPPVRAYYGTSAIVLGCIILVSFGKKSTVLYNTDELIRLFGAPAFVCYFIIMATLTVTCKILYIRKKQEISKRADDGLYRLSYASSTEKMWLATYFAVAAAFWGAQAVVFAKACSMLLFQAFSKYSLSSSHNPLYMKESYFFGVGLIGASAFWIDRLNRALKIFGATYSIPIMQIFWLLFSTLNGGIFYNEFDSITPHKAFSYVIGLLCILWGVIQLCPKEETQRVVENDDEHDELRLIGSFASISSGSYEYGEEKSIPFFEIDNRNTDQSEFRENNRRSNFSIQETEL